MAAAVAVVTISAYSKRIIAAHNTNANAMATVIEMIAQGLNISHADVASRTTDDRAPPIQNQPGR